MVLQSRAIHSEEKASRRADIVAAAGRLLAQDPENFASVAQVAEEAGLAKGTVYLYFKTKEEMLMALHTEHAMAMFDGMDAVLSLPDGQVTPELVADGFVGFVRANPLFLHTAAICHSSLGRNIDPDLLMEHQKAIALRLQRAGSLLLERFPGFAVRGPMAGMDFLHYAFSYAIGTWQLCDPSHSHGCPFGGSDGGNEEMPPELAIFVRDVYADLRVGLLALWYGMAGDVTHSNGADPKLKKGTEMKKELLLSLLAAAVLAACAKAPEPVAEIRPVRVMVAKSTDTGSLAAFAGEIRARTESDQSFRIAGKLLERKAELGALVKRGDVLARLDPQDANLNAAAANASVKQADSELEYAKAELDRTKDLFEKKFLSQGVLDQKVNAFKAASARRDSVRAQAGVAGNQAGYATLVADADGVVTAVSAEPGQVVAAGQPVVRVARLGEKDAIINVAENQVAQVKAAPAVYLHTWANPEKKYTGRVRDIAAAADPQTRTYQVKVEVTNADEELRWGMSASVGLFGGDSASAKAIVLPLTALAQSGAGKGNVWVVGADSKVQPQAVRVGKYGEQGVTITSGLNGGETVVTAGVHKLVAGQMVKPLAEIAAAAPVNPAATTAVPAASTTTVASAAPPIAKAN